MSTIQPAETIRSALTELGVDWEEPTPEVFAVRLPGERKLVTTCYLRVGAREVGLHAFVVRRPDEDHEAVYRFLLERNLRLSRVAFGVDHAGDIHLVGAVPLEAIRSAPAEELDFVLGAVLTASDEHFNRILELGFADSIRREWAWRTARGEPTANLAAFEHLAPHHDLDT